VVENKTKENMEIKEILLHINLYLKCGLGMDFTAIAKAS